MNALYALSRLVDGLRDSTSKASGKSGAHGNLLAHESILNRGNATLSSHSAPLPAKGEIVDSLVAFLDILGTKELVKRGESQTFTLWTSQILAGSWLFNTRGF